MFIQRGIVFGNEEYLLSFPNYRVFVFYTDRFYDIWVFLNNENAWLTPRVREIERNREIFICLPPLQALSVSPRFMLEAVG